MKTVRLPIPHRVWEGSHEVFLADEIKKALKEAGVEYVMETHDQIRVRVLEDQLKLLKDKNIELEANVTALRAANERLENNDELFDKLEIAQTRAENWEARAKEWQSRANYWKGRLEDLIKEKGA